jgi:hypothetical protein
MSYGNIGTKLVACGDIPESGVMSYGDVGTDQVDWDDNSNSVCMVEIETKGVACGDRSEVVIVYADVKMNSAAVGDNLDELVYCMAESVLKMAAWGDRRELATMLRFDALTKAIGAGIVGFVIWVVSIQYQVGLC